jgi:hypothetical protein
MRWMYIEAKIVYSGHKKWRYMGFSKGEETKRLTHPE